MYQVIVNGKDAALRSMGFRTVCFFCCIACKFPTKTLLCTRSTEHKAACMQTADGQRLLSNKQDKDSAELMEWEF